MNKLLEVINDDIKGSLQKHFKEEIPLLLQEYITEISKNCAGVITTLNQIYYHKDLVILKFPEDHTMKVDHDSIRNYWEKFGFEVLDINSRDTLQQYEDKLLEISLLEEFSNYGIIILTLKALNSDRSGRLALYPIIRNGEKDLICFDSDKAFKGSEKYAFVLRKRVNELPGLSSLTIKSTQMNRVIFSNEEECLCEAFVKGLRALDFTKDEISRIIKLNETMQQKFKPILQQLSMEDQRFGYAVEDFEFIVPLDYNHDIYIDTFAQKAREKKNLRLEHSHLEGFTSKQFAKATNKLEAGSKYRVRIFPVLKWVTGRDCIEFLENQKGILVGAHGLCLLQENKPEVFPIKQELLSLDNEESLGDSNSGLIVPYMNHFFDDACNDRWRFMFESFESIHGGNHSTDGKFLLCFSKVS